MVYRVMYNDETPHGYVDLKVAGIVARYFYIVFVEPLDVSQCDSGTP